MHKISLRKLKKAYSSSRLDVLNTGFPRPVVVCIKLILLIPVLQTAVCLGVWGVPSSGAEVESPAAFSSSAAGGSCSVVSSEVSSSSLLLPLRWNATFFSPNFDNWHEHLRSPPLHPPDDPAEEAALLLLLLHLFLLLVTIFNFLLHLCLSSVHVLGHHELLLRGLLRSGANLILAKKKIEISLKSKILFALPRMRRS